MTEPMTDTSDHRIELYLRGDTYGSYDRQQRVLGRVEDLEAEGVVTDTAVDASWQRIRTPEQDSRDEALATYEEFGEWASENGYRLEPAFERRQRSYIGSDAVHDVVVFPMASLAVYEGSDLQAVFPCADESGEINFSVQDCLEAFESGETDWFEQFAPVTVDRASPRLTVNAD
ncbi:HTH domain-containing protein [Halosimplex pelagicum]|nr:HTH domain-containing protein [Halosimplex pelagicum]